jgi:hypothetical protein
VRETTAFLAAEARIEQVIFAAFGGAVLAAYAAALG